MVKSIPLSRNSVEDKMVWPFVSSGVYSIKSGYDFFSKERAMGTQVSTNPNQFQGEWKQIWDEMFRIR